MKLITTYRQTACRLLAALFFLCLFAPMAAGQDNWKDHCATRIANQNGDDGTFWDKAIEIATAEELAYFAQQVNSKQSISYGDGKSIDPAGKDQAGGFMSYYFALSADIDLSDYDWTPIGNITFFKGNFDGRGHCVNGLKVMKVETVSGGSAYAGLFGSTSVGILRNLGVCLADAGIQVNSTERAVYAGGIAGYAHKIFNCYVVGEGRIEIHSSSGFGYVVGGIVGYLDTDGSLANCYATVNVKVGSKGGVYVGGIVGRGNSNSTISHTYATGDVEAGTGDYAGGICGWLENGGTLENSLAANGQIIGGSSYSNRIVGAKGENATLGTNYASPEIQVNGQTISSSAANEANGNAEITLKDFETKLKEGGSNDWDNAWTFPTDGSLPQLKLKGEDSGSNPTYSDWPSETSPQQPIPASDHLIAGSIANTGGGDGLSWDAPILIANRAELAYLAKQVNAGANLTVDKNLSGGTLENKDDSDSGFKGIYFALAADIDLSAHYWTPIGNRDHPFRGNFDGKGHCVKGLRVKVETAVSKYAYAGLFGYASVGTLRNLGVVLAPEGVQAVPSTLASAYAGGIAGRASNISNCYVVGEGEVMAKGRSGRGDSGQIEVTLSDAGGIVGSLNSSLTHCYATVGVKAKGNYDNYAGGIAGYSSTGGVTLSYTYATGAVEAADGTNDNYAGGICGYFRSGTLSNNLALNEQVNGKEGQSNRIAGGVYSYVTLSDNYASTIRVNKKVVSNGNDKDVNGADSWLDTFKGNLIPDPTAADNGWSKAWSWSGGGSSNLPQLKIVKGNADGFLSYTDWLSPSCQPTLPASDYLENKPVPPVEPDPEPEPAPTVYYTVTLPSVTGAVTDPVAGDYEVESWSTFRFYLTLDTAYNQSQPVVTTSRGETLQPRSSDGAYLVKYVRTDVEIFIDGIEKNPPPVANETIRAESPEPEIWSENACLCIRLPEGLPSSPVRIFTPEGRLLDSFRSVPGLNRRQLPTNIYIVQVGATVRKVAVR
ncbi:GLUG motif-containing protein [Parabacteroides gordonii]|uniref:GLUG motif-containing protein n=1 Tax=Parabacteroides gordonii TaxID=574930 RepID=UPI000EBE07B8|nr:GLUG motif-containing protein [Parabacteroides gordonii]RGP16509.1 hypothetical protein DXB27_10600 [Parabacteroides gordonii]